MKISPSVELSWKAVRSAASVPSWSRRKRWFPGPAHRHRLGIFRRYSPSIRYPQYRSAMFLAAKKFSIRVPYIRACSCRAADIPQTTARAPRPDRTALRRKPICRHTGGAARAEIPVRSPASLRWLNVFSFCFLTKKQCIRILFGKK